MWLIKLAKMKEIISIVVCFILKRTNIKVIIIIIIIITAKLITDYRC